MVQTIFGTAALQIGDAAILSYGRSEGYRARERIRDTSTGNQFQNIIRHVAPEWWRYIEESGAAALAVHTSILWYQYVDWYRKSVKDAHG